jgi:hypothetical protein
MGQAQNIGVQMPLKGHDAADPASKNIVGNQPDNNRTFYPEPCRWVKTIFLGERHNGDETERADERMGAIKSKNPERVGVLWF